LLEYSALKTLAEQIGIEVVDRRHSLLSVKFHAETRVDPARLMGLVGKTRGAQFTPRECCFCAEGSLARARFCATWRRSCSS